MAMSEKNEAKRIGARLHRNSGRGRFEKADASTDRYVIDIKEYSKSFSVSKASWSKICTDTVKVDVNKEPVLCLVLGEQQKTRLAVIAWDEFEELNRIRDEYYGSQHD